MEVKYVVCARDLRPGSCVSAVCVIYILDMLHLLTRLCAAFFTPLSYRSTADLPLGGGFFRLGAGLGGRRGGRSAEEACGAVPGKVCPHHGAQFDTRVPRPTPHCCGEFYASTLTWAHDSIGLSMIG